MKKILTLFTLLLTLTIFSCSPEPDVKPQNTDTEPKFKTETRIKK